MFCTWDGFKKNMVPIFLFRVFDFADSSFGKDVAVYSWRMWALIMGLSVAGAEGKFS